MTTHEGNLLLAASVFFLAEMVCCLGERDGIANADPCEFILQSSNLFSLFFLGFLLHANFPWDMEMGTYLLDQFYLISYFLEALRGQ